MSGKSESGRRLTCKRRESSDDDIYDITTQPLNTATSAHTSTPVRVSNPSEDEESPYFPCSTQELQDEVDVLWKWNSPLMKQYKTKRPKKRLIMQSSPKIPLRRHPSADAQSKKDFEKLREELRALRDELNRPDNEESLALSPREEREIKDEVDFLETSAIGELMNTNLQEPWDSDPDDVFNDDMEDIMIQCSQQVEVLLQAQTSTGSDVNNVPGLNSALGTTGTSNKVNSRTDSRQHFGTTRNKFFSEKPHTPVTSSLQDNRAMPSTKATTSNLPKFSFKKNTVPNNRDQKNLTPSQEMVTFNKVLEPLIQEEKQVANNDKNIEFRKESSSCFVVSKPTEKSILPKTAQLDAVFDDSFDMILSQMGDEDLDQLTQVVDIKTHNRNITNCTPTSNDNPVKNDVLKNLVGTLTNTGTANRTVTTGQILSRPVVTNSLVGTSTNNARTTIDKIHGQIGTTKRTSTTGHVQSRPVVTNNLVGTSTNTTRTTTNTTHGQTELTNRMAATGQSRPVVTDNLQSRMPSTNQIQIRNLTNKKSTVFPRCNSDGAHSGGKVQTATGKVEFHRTQSFEICNGSLSRNKWEPDENRTSTRQPIREFSDSPIKCSPEEIEKKRLAALAIREAKKQKEIIEKNRQEALRKLEERRKRNAQNVKSSLVKRL